MTARRVAIVGAGKIGTALARLALQAGHTVRLTGTGRNPMTAMIVETLAPGARLVPFQEAVTGVDLVVLAIPLSAVDAVDWAALDGRIVVDLMNAWQPGGAAREELPARSTTQELASEHPGVRLVKSLNHLSHDELEACSRTPDAKVRWGVLVASDDTEAAHLVAEFVDSLGYDPVIAPASGGILADPGGPLFGRCLEAGEIAELVGGGLTHPPTAAAAR